VYLATGVLAIFAEALHTLSDVFISGFLLAAMLWSRKQADEEHAFGHERAQNVAALVAATLFISFTSFRLFEEAVPRLFQPHEATYQNLPLAVGVLVVSMVAVAAPLLGLYREKQRGAAARAQLLELVNDELGLVAALAGTLLVAVGEPLADPIAAIVVATVIAVNAVGLLRENVSFLLGRSPGPEFAARAVALAKSVPGVLGVHGLRAEYVGPSTLHTGMHVVVARGIPVEEAARIADEVRETIHREMGRGYCVVHVDAAPPEQAAGSPDAPGRGSLGAW
jgi:cation diffusion facilitator family transporter